jgi:hypothetical protein
MNGKDTERREEKGGGNGEREKFPFTSPRSGAAMTGKDILWHTRTGLENYPGVIEDTGLVC